MEELKEDLLSAKMGEKKALEDLGTLEEEKQAVDMELEKTQRELATGGGGDALKAFKKEVGLTLKVVDLLLDGADDTK